MSKLQLDISRLIKWIKNRSDAKAFGVNWKRKLNDKEIKQWAKQLAEQTAGSEAEYDYTDNEESSGGT